MKLMNLHRRKTLTVLGFMMAGVRTSGKMTGVRMDGMKIEKKLVTNLQAHFLWEVLILVQ